MTFFCFFPMTVLPFSNDGFTLLFSQKSHRCYILESIPKNLNIKDARTIAYIHYSTPFPRLSTLYDKIFKNFFTIQKSA